MIDDSAKPEIELLAGDDQIVLLIHWPSMIEVEEGDLVPGAQFDAAMARRLIDGLHRALICIGEE